MKLWRTTLGRAVILGLAVGTVGALIGLGVAVSRETDPTSGVAWGLYITGALLLFLGSAPSIAPPPGAAVSAMLPEAAKAQVMQRQGSRITGAPWMLLNFFVAVALIGIGAVFEIYG